MPLGTCKDTTTTGILVGERTAHNAMSSYLALSSDWPPPLPAYITASQVLAAAQWNRALPPSPLKASTDGDQDMSAMLAMRLLPLSRALRRWSRHAYLRRESGEARTARGHTQLAEWHMHSLEQIMHLSNQSLGWLPQVLDGSERSLRLLLLQRAMRVWRRAHRARALELRAARQAHRLSAATRCARAWAALVQGCKAFRRLSAARREAVRRRLQSAMRSWRASQLSCASPRRRVLKRSSPLLWTRSLTLPPSPSSSSTSRARACSPCISTRSRWSGTTAAEDDLRLQHAWRRFARNGNREREATVRRRAAADAMRRRRGRRRAGAALKRWRDAAAAGAWLDRRGSLERRTKGGFARERLPRAWEKWRNHIERFFAARAVPTRHVSMPRVYANFLSRLQANLQLRRTERRARHSCIIIARRAALSSWHANFVTSSSLFTRKSAALESVWRRRRQRALHALSQHARARRMLHCALVRLDARTSQRSMRAWCIRASRWREMGLAAEFARTTSVVRCVQRWHRASSLMALRAAALRETLDAALARAATSAAAAAVAALSAHAAHAHATRSVVFSAEALAGMQAKRRGFACFHARATSVSALAVSTNAASVMHASELRRRAFGLLRSHARDMDMLRRAVRALMNALLSSTLRLWENRATQASYSFERRVRKQWTRRALVRWARYAAAGELVRKHHLTASNWARRSALAASMKAMRGCVAVGFHAWRVRAFASLVRHGHVVNKFGAWAALRAPWLRERERMRAAATFRSATSLKCAWAAIDAAAAAARAQRGGVEARTRAALAMALHAWREGAVVRANTLRLVALVGRQWWVGAVKEALLGWVQASLRMVCTGLHVPGYSPLRPVGCAAARELVRSTNTVVAVQRDADRGSQLALWRLVRNVCVLRRSERALAALSQWRGVAYAERVESRVVAAAVRRRQAEALQSWRGFRQELHGRFVLRRRTERSCRRVLATLLAHGVESKLAAARETHARVHSLRTALLRLGVQCQRGLLRRARAEEHLYLRKGRAMAAAFEAMAEVAAERPLQRQRAHHLAQFSRSQAQRAPLRKWVSFTHSGAALRHAQSLVESRHLQRVWRSWGDWQATMQLSGHQRTALRRFSARKQLIVRFFSWRELAVDDHFESLIALRGLEEAATVQPEHCSESGESDETL